MAQDLYSTITMLNAFNMGMVQDLYTVEFSINVFNMGMVSVQYTLLIYNGNGTIFVHCTGSATNNLNYFMTTPTFRHECPQISENVPSF